MSEHVCQTLKDDILSGRLPPGHRLTEASIMSRTGVSRTPVREGVRRLEGEGLVNVPVPGAGHVRHVPAIAQEALLIYDCRLVLEPYLTELAAERMTVEALAGIRHVLDRFVHAVNEEAEKAVRLDADFHLAIYSASQSELMSVLRGYWSRLQMSSPSVSTRRRFRAGFVREHEGILQALEQRDRCQGWKANGGAHPSWPAGP